MVATARRAVRKAFLLKALAERELSGGSFGLSPAERARWLSRGFLTESAAFYGLTEENWRPYLTDFERSLRTPFINGIYNPVLNDKLVFHHTMVTLGAPTPAVYGLVTPDMIAWICPPDGAAAGGFHAVLEAVGEVVLKPRHGGLGERVHFVSLRDGEFAVTGAPAGEAAVSALLTPGTLICERIRQGAYAEAIFPGATNTVRLVTMWDYEAKEPFVAAAEHRFGTSGSAPLDNVSRGGLFVNIGRDTGVIEEAVQVSDGSLSRVSRHPDTGALIAGVQVPGWQRALGDVLAVAARLAHVPYIGWDVVVGDQGVQLIEGNTYPDSQTQAVTGPYLADPRTRRFFERHGALVAPRAQRRGTTGRRALDRALSLVNSARAVPKTRFARQGEIREAPRR